MMIFRCFPFLLLALCCHCRAEFGYDDLPNEGVDADDQLYYDAENRHIEDTINDAKCPTPNGSQSVFSEWFHRCLVYSDGEMTYDNAEKWCNQRGGHLAQLFRRQEVRMAWENRPSDNIYWIGVAAYKRKRDVSSPRNIYEQLGIPLSERPMIWDQKQQRVRLMTAYDNLLENDERCLALDRACHTEHPCAQKHHAVCTVGTVKSPCEDGWSFLGERCFKRIKFVGNWLKARSICREFGATLASITTQEEANFLKPMLQDSNHNRRLIALGGLLIPNSTRTRWLDQSINVYTPWAAGEPRFQPGERRVVAAFWVPSKEQTLWRAVLPETTFRRTICQRRPKEYIFTDWYKGFKPFGEDVEDDGIM